MPLILLKLYLSLSFPVISTWSLMLLRPYTIWSRVRKYLSFIKEIFHLSPPEALATWRVIKSIGCKPSFFLISFTAYCISSSTTSNSAKLSYSRSREVFLVVIFSTLLETALIWIGEINLLNNTLFFSVVWPSFLFWFLEILDVLEALEAFVTAAVLNECIVWPTDLTLEFFNVMEGP